MIFITTAGSVGAASARLLAGRGEQVRVLVRRPEKAGDLAQAGVDVVEGDLAVPATVDAALDGVTRVVLVSTAGPQEELNVVHGAVRSGVEHLVKITSAAAPDSPVARQRDQYRVEQGLIASGLGWTLLRNNAYMQNFLMLAPGIAGSGAFASNTGAGRIGMVDTRDVAAAAVAVVGRPDSHAGATYRLAGPRSLSYDDAAGILSSVLGRPVRFDPLTDAEQTRQLLDAGLAPALAASAAHALSLFATGDHDWVTDDVEQLTGVPPRAFATFVGDHRAAFS